MLEMSCFFKIRIKTLICCFIYLFVRISLCLCFLFQLGTQSNDDDEKPAPQAYMVSTVNKGFRKRDAIDGVYFIGDDKIKH